jgi:hypothetical protein
MLTVKFYRIVKNGIKTKKPFYEVTFKDSNWEPNEIAGNKIPYDVYGMAGACMEADFENDDIRYCNYVMEVTKQ